MKFYSNINPPYTFCESGIFEGKVESLLCSTLFTNQALIDISNIYDDMRQNINKIVFIPPHTEYNKLYPLCASCLNSPSKINNSMLMNNKNVWAGHDLPVWINNPEIADVKIMIVGQNPYRNPNEMNANNCPSIGISTPWGIHSWRWRSGSQRGLPFHLAMNMIDMCTRRGKLLSVYVTDVYKLCAVNSKSLDRFNNQVYKSIIYDEVALVNPDIILAVGTVAYNILSKRATIKNNQKNILLKVLHPNAHESKWAGINDSIASFKGDSYLCEINNFAHQLGIC